MTISVIITAHSESILTHRTIASVRRALDHLSPQQSAEIILHVDNPTSATQEYIDIHKNNVLNQVRIFTNHFGDLGMSRNFAVQQAKGEYIATIDADDIMSKQWLSKAINLLEMQTEPTIAHSEYTVEFEGTDSLIVKHGEINYDTDTLLSVYANRWNSVIVAPRDLLLNNLYTPNSPGYGYEDWNLNCRLIYLKAHNLLVSESAIFVRRKRSNSEWARQVQSMSVLRANPLLAFDNIRSVADPFRKVPPLTQAPAHYQAMERAKILLKRSPATHKIARYIKRSLKRRDITPQINGSHVPQWLQTEWKELHSIDRQIFPSKHLMENISVYDTITEDHKIAGSLYKALVDQLNFDSYPYIIFTPWLTRGGADKYTIEYANAISELTKSHVLVVGTVPVPSPWKDKLLKDVDFLDFGNTTAHASREIHQRLMEHLIENSGAKVLHVINSEFGYDFIQLHEGYIKSSDKRVVVTSFSQSADSRTGRVYGYSHTHVPLVYDIADIITSDNQAIVDMWINEYGFNPNKLLVHHQPMNLERVPSQKKDFIPRSPLRILWAGRIAPEKLPEIAIDVGKRLKGVAEIDMYGTKEPGFDELLENLPSNIKYKGSYDGFDSFNANQYDALLYTSLFDGMPNVILESARVKLPIIASGVGGIPEFIKNNESGGVITDIYNIDGYVDAIMSLAKDSNRGALYANQAYENLKISFSREQYINSVAAMLRTLNILT